MRRAIVLALWGVALLVWTPRSLLSQQMDSYEVTRQRFIPEDDSRAALAELARAAAIDNVEPRFLSMLDSLAASATAAPNALAYWGALSIQHRGDATAVAERYAAYLRRPPGDVAALSAMFRVLVGNGALAQAESLLAGAAGIRSETVAMLRGELEEASGRPAGAIAAYLVVVESGGGAAVAAVAAIEAVFQRWPPGRTRDDAVAVLREARSGASEAEARLIAPLLVEAYVGDGRWEDAVEAANDRLLPLESQGEHLRRVAAAAVRADAGAAQLALDALFAIEPTVVRPTDRLLVAEVARVLGDHERAATELRAAALAGVPGAGAGALVSEVEAARASGDRNKLEAALLEALAEGVDASVIALPLGDVWLARQRPDSAIASYAAAVTDGGAVDGSVDALSRIRLVQWLLRADVDEAAYGTLGQALIEAPRRPAAAATRVDALAREISVSDTIGVAPSLLVALSGEWRGRAGDATGASQLLATASEGSESAPLLLAAGRWAEAAEDRERAVALWRRVIDEHAGTPYALEARRRLAAASERS